MPETAENVAEDYGISAPTRTPSPCAASSAAAAQAAGGFDGEIVPVTIPRSKGEPVIVDKDEHPRADTTLDSLAR
jgi:acetyl-CoA acyltransferase